jgi:hypothetical protein
MNQRTVALLLGLMLLGMHVAALAEENSAEAERLFESKVRPLLVERCFKCHSDKASKGGLRLDSRSAVLQGGETGAAVVVGKPDESPGRSGPENRLPWSVWRSRLPIRLFPRCPTTASWPRLFSFGCERIRWG